MHKIDLNRVWDDARAMGSANKDLLGAIAGMFILLPFVLVIQFMNMPDVRPDASATQQDVAAFYRTILEANWYLFIGWTLVSCFGSLAMLSLLLRQERPTVAESLKSAVLLLPSFFIAFIVRNVAFEIGMILFVIPALYLMGRLVLIAPVAAAESQLNPLTMIQRSFALTHRNGWRVFLLFFVLFCTTMIMAIVLTTLVGVIGALIMPEDLASLLVSVALGAVIAGFYTFGALLSAAVYRAATSPASNPWLPG